MMMTEAQTATQQGEMIAAKSIENYQRDRRFRALVDRAVKEAMEKYGRIDPRDADEAAFRIAREAVVFALKTAFEDDAELKYTREMLAKTMATMLRGLDFLPSPSIWVTGPASSNSHQS